MRAVVTRVAEASVTIDREVVGKIGQGFLILLGITHEDGPEQCRKLAEKVLGLRVFTDENDKMNKSLADVGGQGIAAMEDAPALSPPPGRSRPSHCMSSSCASASGWAFRPSMGSSARRWQWPLSTTAL